MKKLICTLTLGAGLLLGLSGCDLYQPDVDSLLTPPVLSELQTEVDEALRDVVGQELRLCYPAGGSYRSPYIFTDLDGDEEQEAVVFYTVEDEPLVYLQILDKSDGRWRARNALPGTEGEVLFVDFRHLSGDGATDLLVGWREPDREFDTLYLYRYRDAALSEEFHVSCDGMAIADFDGDGSMKIFPVAKSTELMFLNETDWEKFAQATGAAYDDLSTVEGLVATAGAYYDWTDAQTPEPDDGKALFGRDAMANYMLVGARQLGDTLFEVQDGKMTLNFDKDVARKLWDNYYVPFVKGWFAAIGRFRSDDIKVGNVLAYVGSNSSATFFPTQVMVNDTESYDIDMTVLPSPKFAGGEDVAVQQGAGMVVTAGTEEEINASVEFLKWFTQPENNISFSVDSGYLPVTTAANNIEAIKTSGLELSPKMESILSNAVQSVKNNTLYTPSAFAGGNKARNVLEYSLSDLASADRATVQERVAAGQPAADAEAEFLTDEYFDAWYGGICAALEKYAG